MIARPSVDPRGKPGSRRKPRSTGSPHRAGDSLVHDMVSLPVRTGSVPLVSNLSAQPFRWVSVFDVSQPASVSVPSAKGPPSGSPGGASKHPAIYGTTSGRQHA